MPRLPRFCPVGIPQHIIQRGHNRQPCFLSKLDFGFYLRCMDEAARSHCVDIHAWVLMTNHVHLLATPQQRDGLSLMMQGIGRRYVLNFNKHHNCHGTLWEGRFKPCLIDSDNYLLRCYRYIELNPVRAGMVASPELYPWSSFKCNALGRRSRLVVPHKLYMSLGRTERDRTAAYRHICSEALTGDQLKEIRKAINSGKVLGGSRNGHKSRDSAAQTIA